MMFVRGKCGAKLAVYDPNPCGKETVLMVHGWPLAARMYEYQERMLVCRGYRVVTFDLPGFGNSSAPARGYCYDCLADDVYAVVRALGLRRFTLVGFSMGGAVVLRYMRRHRGFGVKKLALLAAAAPRFTRTEEFPQSMTREEVNGLIRQAETDRAQMNYDFSRKLLYSPHSEAIQDWFQDIAQQANQLAVARTGISLRDENGERDLNCVHVPTAIFHGTEDEVVPFDLGEYQHLHIPCSHLIPFEQSGHAVFYDELERFQRLFLRFLED